MSIREPENVNDRWKTIFQYGFGTLAIGGSALTFILIVVWLFTSPNDGLGPRPTSGVTSEYFNWHPFLMSLAFLIFMAPAVLSFEIFPAPRETNKGFHGFFNTLALLSAFAGFAIILDCHNNLSSTGSFHTVHGCIGLVVLIVFALNYFLALVLYGFQVGGELRGTLKPLHKRLGLCTIILGLVNITLGLMEQELKKSLTGSIHQLTNAIGVICVFMIIGIIFTIVKFMDKKPTDVVGYVPIGDKESVKI